MELNRFKQLLESSMGNVKPLINESVDIKKPEEDEWCKSNVKDVTKQICIIKTPDTGDKEICRKKTGSLARQEGYTENVIIDVDEPNVCRTVWRKLL